MDVLAQVFEIAKTIYSLCDQARSNRRQCDRLKHRIKMLLLTVQTVERNNKKSPALQIMAEELVITLENAKSWVMKYSKTAWWRKILQAYSIKEEFDVITERLVDASSYISLQLSADIHLDMHQKFDRDLIQQQDIEDIKQDLRDMTYDIQDMRRMMEAQSNPRDKAKRCQFSSRVKRKDLTNSVHRMDDITEEDIKDMDAAFEKYCMTFERQELRKDIARENLKLQEIVLERERHCLYRGEYFDFPVAIKVFRDHNGESEEHIRETFQNEEETIKKRDCMSLVHLYGLSIDNSGPETSYSLVMEWCSKGSLREVLEKEPDLTWEQKIRMAADVARAIYRILQAEEIITSGTLSSTKFLVDETYCVKLSWISNTETCIKRITLGEITKKSVLDYLAPETPTECETYSKSSALYSLGVLMFEIAAGKRPFEGLEVTEENLVQMQEQWWDNLEDELPSSCPQVLQDLIKRLLQKNPEDRPSAGVVVDLLLSYLNKCELELNSAEASA